MVNTSPFSPESRYDAYESYLANKRINVAPMLGTNVCLATVTLGLTEAATPYSGESFKSPESTNSFEIYANPVGEIALAPVVQLDDYRNRRTTPRQALASLESQIA
jgi:hypothetical protein